ncbi:MAG TPA: hypothetical protein VF607_17160 [Verrucomicrobiae bacterium]
MKLSILSVILGLGMGLPQIYGMARPAQLAATARRFPRNYAAGVVLMLLATGWFLYNFDVEPIADFSSFKVYMEWGFGAVGVLSCYFVRDFLAVRGFAVLLLLLGKLMVDTGRPHLGESPFVLVIQAWAYALVVAGIWFTITPWKMRDFIEWATQNEGRTRLLSSLRLAFALFILILGVTAFRTM